MDVGTLKTDAFAKNDATAGADYAGAAGVNVQLGDITGKTNHAVSAYLGNTVGSNPKGDPNTTLTIHSGGMNLNATAENTVDVPQVKIDAALVTVEKMKPEADAGGSTRAYAGGGFDINASGVNATAKSTNSAKSEALAFTVDLVGADASEKSAHTSNTTEAFVNTSANLNVTGGAIGLTATSGNEAAINQITPINVGAVQLNFVKSTAEAGGATHAFVGEGATVKAAGLSADASSNNSAHIDKFQFGASVFSLQKAEPVAKTTHETSAYVGPAAGVDPNGGLSGKITLNGNLDLNANSVNDAQVGEVNIDLALVGVDLVSPDINAGGSTRVNVGGNYTVNAAGITGHANAKNTAGSSSVPIKLGLVEVTDIDPVIHTTHETEAFVSRDAHFDLTGGGIALDAVSRNEASFTGSSSASHW
jgi:hypothetical protein